MNAVAPEGQVWVCTACGKRSKDIFGKEKIDRGWDESCMLHALLCYEDKLVIIDGRVQQVQKGGVVKEKEE